jgi:hypothetical protein
MNAVMKELAANVTGLYLRTWNHYRQFNSEVFMFHLEISEEY